MSDSLETRLERILSAPTEQQEAMLDAESGGDASVRAELQALLDLHHDPALDFLDRPALQLPPDPNEALGAQSRLGRYEIVRRLGEGASGIVFEARQSNPSRRVAIKVLRALATGSRWIERFRSEGEVLARLRHPGITEVYEAGEFPSPTGPQPFLAMELVRGRAWHEVVPALGRRPRLQLFLSVCEAVAHCHAHGVVHRDLKPTNVLVDGDGRPRLIDFGIARPSEATEWSLVLPTLAGLEGTLTYMSPEQASPRDGEVADVRSDVYSLGVMLYETLAGRPPLQLEGRPLAAAIRTIQEDVPARLSQHDRTLRGDLEVIVGKAMAKEPAARYGSAAELAEDVRRFLASEPIHARQPTRSYLLRRFVRRNRALTAIAGTALLLVLAGAGVALGFAFEARDQAALAEQRRQQSERRLELAQGALGLLFGDVLDELPNHLGTTRLTEQVLTQGTDYYTRLAEEVPDSFEERRRLWTAFERLAQARLRAGSHPEATRAAVRRYHAMVLAEAAAAPVGWDPTLDVLRAEWLATRVGDHERLPFAMAAAQRLAADPEATAGARLAAANVLRESGDPRHVQRAHELVDGVLAGDPNDFAARLMRTGFRQRELNEQLAQKDHAGVLTTTEQMLAEYEVALRRQPSAPALLEARCICLTKRAIALGELGRMEESTNCFTEAHNQTLQLMRLDPTYVRLRPTLGWIQTTLAARMPADARRQRMLEYAVDNFAAASTFDGHQRFAARAACQLTAQLLAAGDAPESLAQRWRTLVERGLAAEPIAEAIDALALSPAARAFVAPFQELALQRRDAPPAAAAAPTSNAAGEPQPR